MDVPESWKWMIDNDTFSSLFDQISKTNEKNVVKDTLNSILEFTEVIQNPSLVKGIIVYETSLVVERIPGVVSLFLSMNKIKIYDNVKWLCYVDWLLKNLIEKSTVEPLPILFVNSYYFCKQLSGINNLDVVKFLDKNWFLLFYKCQQSSIDYREQ